MKGYYKVELRPCECGNDYLQKHMLDEVSCNKCENLSQTVEAWNTRETFDKAIDALFDVFNCTDERFTEATSIDAIEELTGLTWSEALEIYKQRQEGKHD